MNELSGFELDYLIKERQTFKQNVRQITEDNLNNRIISYDDSKKLLFFNTRINELNSKLSLYDKKAKHDLNTEINELIKEISILNGGEFSDIYISKKNTDKVKTATLVSKYNELKDIRNRDLQELILNLEFEICHLTQSKLQNVFKKYKNGGYIENEKLTSLLKKHEELNAEYSSYNATIQQFSLVLSEDAEVLFESEIFSKIAKAVSTNLINEKLLETIIFEHKYYSEKYTELEKYEELKNSFQKLSYLISDKCNSLIIELKKEVEFEQKKYESSRDKFIEQIPIDLVVKQNLLIDLSGIAKNTILTHRVTSIEDKNGNVITEDKHWYNSKGGVYNLKLFAEWIKIFYPTKYPIFKQKVIDAALF